MNLLFKTGKNQVCEFASNAIAIRFFDEALSLPAQISQVTNVIPVAALAST